MAPNECQCNDPKCPIRNYKREHRDRESPEGWTILALECKLRTAEARILWLANENHDAYMQGYADGQEAALDDE